MIVDPMLAAGVKDDYWIKKALNSSDWVVEEKFDGSRYIVQFDDKGCAKVTSRRISVVTGKHVEKTANFPHILLPTFCIPELAGCIFDGEMVGPNGFPSTVSICGSDPENALAYQRQNGWATYHVFDVLYFKGSDTQKSPYLLRREGLWQLLDIWKAAIPGHAIHIQGVPSRVEGKEQFYQDVISRGGEGVILKRLDSPYVQGSRKKEFWIKMKKSQTYDVVITGFTDPDKYSTDVTGKQVINKFYAKGWIGAITFGVWAGGRILHNSYDSYINVGTTSGMDERLRKKMSMNPSNFINQVIEVEGQELTRDGKIRHPRFMRLRFDKNPKDCTMDSLYAAGKKRKGKAIKKEAL